MSTLAQIYSQATGLKLSKPFICKKFFPLSEERYLTIQPFSKNQPAKCYDYWNEVLFMLLPLLRQNNIRIYQIGEKDEPALYGVTPLNGQTSICQANYVIQNSILHLSADSFTAHAAGAMGVPQVSLYGNTDSSIHGPAWRGNAILIDSHRNGNKPSFSHEHDKTINKITPEEIANSVLKLLNAQGKINRNSLFFGLNYANSTIEWVPNTPLDANFLKDAPIIARFDYHPEEAYLFNALQGRKLSIVTKSDINANALHQLKNNIIGITLILNKDSTITKEFVKNIKSIGIKINAITFEEDSDVSSVRLDFFDYIQIHKVSLANKQDFVNQVNNYTNSLDGDKLLCEHKLWFRSNKFTLSNGKFYLSYFHYLNDLPTDSLENNIMQFVDDPNFYKDTDYFYVFGQSV